MREIGGFIELEKNRGQEFHRDCIALNSGRNCLRYIIRARKIKKIWLPKLLCSAISNTCKEEQVEIKYYQINNNLRPVFPSISKNEWMYLINYYGQYDEEEIMSYYKQCNNLIVDNAHSFYSKCIKGIDTIYTCRKFFGVPDGGYLYTTCKYNDKLEQDESFERMRFLLGRFERSAQEFYEDYRNNEEVIGALPMRYMSKVTKNLLCGINYEADAEIRKENFKYLHNKLKALNQIKVRVPKGPYMYPFYFENGNDIRKKLQKEGIYIPLLWPNVVDNLKVDEIEYKLAVNILPLPCDQRYTWKDMDYIVKQIKQVGGF